MISSSATLAPPAKVASGRKPTPDEPGFLVDIDAFSGPLGLLLHLIRSQDIDIFDIPVARITAQFLEAISGIDEGDLDDAGEFLELAATLLHIKARLLLPQPDELDVEDPRANLVRRLLEYEQVRELALLLREAEASKARLRSRGYLPPKSAERHEEPELKVAWADVMAAAMRVKAPVRHRHRPPVRVITVREKVALIVKILHQRKRVEFRELVTGLGGGLHTAMTLLASLELARRRVLRLRQSRPFAPLWLYRGKGA